MTAAELEAIRVRCADVTERSPIVYRDCVALLKEIDRLKEFGA